MRCGYTHGRIYRAVESSEHTTPVICAGTHRYTLLKHRQGKSLSGPLREGKLPTFG